MKKPAVSLIALVLVFGSAGAIALSSDRDQPVEIEADWAEADDQRLVTVYKGGVVITQGTIRITGDTVTMHYNRDWDLVKMVAEGRPARFRQQPDGAPHIQRAKAKRMEYYTDKDLIVLTGDAHSWQGEDRISAGRIVFDTLRGRVEAETEPPAAGANGAEGKPRVRITIMPRKKCRSSDGQTVDCPK